MVQGLLLPPDRPTEQSPPQQAILHPRKLALQTLPDQLMTQLTDPLATPPSPPAPAARTLLRLSQQHPRTTALAEAVPTDQVMEALAQDRAVEMVDLEALVLALDLETEVEAAEGLTEVVRAMHQLRHPQPGSSAEVMRDSSESTGALQVLRGGGTAQAARLQSDSAGE